MAGEVVDGVVIRDDHVLMSEIPVDYRSSINYAKNLGMQSPDPLDFSPRPER